MENAPLFSLSIDAAGKAHLSEAAKWARFLAIIGFVFVGLTLAVGIGLAFFISTSFSGLSSPYHFDNESTAGVAGSVIASYLFTALIGFFPLMYLLRFANRTRRALATDDQDGMTAAFQNLKIVFRYIGILSIISLILVAIVVVMGILFYGLYTRR